MDKVLQDIGLCRRAGALCLGTDAVTGALKAQRAAVVVISAQLSEKSQKEMRFLSEKYQAEIASIALTSPRNLPAPGRRQLVYVIFRFSTNLCFW